MKAYELLDSMEKWTQRTLACNAVGFPVSTDSPEAVQWCLRGAINRCYPHPDDALYEDTPLGKADIKLFAHFKELGIGPASWNDQPTRKYEEVVALLKELDL